MERQVLYFVGPGQIEVRQEALAPPGCGQALVQTIVSGISAGTEMLLYRGETPQGLPTDATIAALSGELRYPLPYGYAAVGRVTGLGDGVDPGWRGRLVLAFQPHVSHFVARPDELMPVPGGISAETATLLPNLETAISLVMDGRPVVGERVAVIGQGVVGLLTTWLLAQFPLADLVTLDRYSQRREVSHALGARRMLDPDESLPTDFDLVYELSGQPAALNQAIALTGYAGRIIVGSWYGAKQAPLDLGGRFHRDHIHITSSQVSSLAPQWRGRWDKARRLKLAWEHLGRLPAERLISHSYRITQAVQAYRQLDKQPATHLHTLLDYPA